MTSPGETIDFVVTDAQITGYDTDTSAWQDLRDGDGVRLDGVLTALPTGQGYITDGNPLKQLGDPVYFEYLAGAIDKGSATEHQHSGPDDETIQGMLADGTLKQLSEEVLPVRTWQRRGDASIWPA